MELQDQLKNMIYSCTNLYHATIGFGLYKTLHYRQYRQIRKNAGLKDIHKGQRCFILGNGPSLADEDLSPLADEYVFTVNQIVRNKQFQSMKTNYHFWADPTFFKIDKNNPADMELLNTMKSVDTDENRPLCFFPIEQEEFVEKFQLNEDLNIQYYKSKMFFTKGYPYKINYAKYTPYFGTVVQWAIMMAVFMGFREIYLLGVDSTGIIANINSALKQDNSESYGYHVTENEKARMESLIDSNQTLNKYLRSFIYLLDAYRFIRQYCNKRGIKLINCSSRTLIDSIPRKTLNEILSETSQ